MYCPVCGRQVEGSSNFCSGCGTAIAPLPPPARRLYRSRFHRMVGGVCAGVALYNGWEISMVRLAMVVLVLFAGVGTIAYVIAWIVIPQEPLWLPADMTAGEPRTS